MSETSETFINKTINTFTNRLKIPLVSTYVIVLIFNSWDIIYYLIFQTGDANTKIRYIKSHYNSWSIVGESLLYAIALLVIFTIFDAGLTWFLKSIVIFKKQTTDEVQDYNTIKNLDEKIRVESQKVIELNEKFESTREELKIQVNLNRKYIKEKDFNKKYVSFGKLINSIDDLNSFLNLLIEIKQILKVEDEDEGIINLYTLIYKLSKNQIQFDNIESLLDKLAMYGYINYFQRIILLEDGTEEEQTHLKFNENFDYLIKLLKIKTTP
ncbi:hypothetical protein [Empedobacter brevis]|uniref:hypothetical protein n=1 Tax=Empedobacter brevis TaxID=247 RepID=UPI0028AB7C48|nr:hypothetical protein [Empedobacter brevis]